MKKTLLTIILMSVISFFPSYGKKIKNSFSIEKELKVKKGNLSSSEGRKVEISDSIFNERKDLESLSNVSFAGYNKEVNSPSESFIIINSSDHIIKGFEVKIDYLDIKDRKIHSRNITEHFNVPAGETRHIDVKSWDNQRVYYYYLGNEPKKVATPYKVSFTPIAYWIEE